MRARTKGRLAFTAAGIILAAVAVFAAYLAVTLNDPMTEDPDPEGVALDVETDSGMEIPAVDWDYWTSINPDVIGWVTVPGTTIDFPVLQAPADDPDYYLTHDVYRRYKPSGSVYLDAGCAGGLEGAGNKVVFGHHWGRAMFSPFAEYSERSFAEGHRTVILQTPRTAMILEVQAVDVIRGTDAVKRTDFASAVDLMAYWLERFSASDVRLAEEAVETDRLYTFVTCSYNFWPSNERTLVYATETLSCPQP